MGRFQYTGQVWLPQLGLYHYKARTYSPTLGRFLQTDPIGYGDGLNMYAYVGNDPVNRIDPSGLCSRPFQNPTSVTITFYDRVVDGKRNGKWDPGETVVKRVQNYTTICLDDNFDPFGLGGPYAGPGNGGGGGGGTPTSRCSLGNSFARASDMTGKLSAAATGLGAGMVVIGGFNPLNPATDAGLVTLRFAGASGDIALGLQLTAGLLQGSETGNYENARRAVEGGAVTTLLGFAMGFIQPVPNFAMSSGRRDGIRMFGAVSKTLRGGFGLMQNLDSGIAPIQVSCGGS